MEQSTQPTIEQPTEPPIHPTDIVFDNWFEKHQFETWLDTGMVINGYAGEKIDKPLYTDGAHIDGGILHILKSLGRDDFKAPERPLRKEIIILEVLVRMMMVLIVKIQEMIIF